MIEEDAHAIIHIVTITSRSPCAVPGAAPVQLAGGRPDHRQICELEHVLAALFIAVCSLAAPILSSDSSLLANNRQTYLEADGVALEL